ncbi:MAG: hypothetical protein Kilf2KO_01160 [Rhodospirillales bacterium]
MMAKNGIELSPLHRAPFGARCRFMDARDAEAQVLAAEDNREAFLEAFYASDGFFLLEGMEGIREDPALLLRLSRLFGPEVEDYRQTLRARHRIHPEVPEILQIAGTSVGAVKPPAPPDPPLTADGKLPVQFPHRRGWHTDQSFRRPPPDISLFLAVVPAPWDQGQTLFADGTAAYAALPADLKALVRDLEGLHVMPGSGRAEQDVRAGKTPDPLAPHERPQRQPVVRVHPVTGKPALYLCESGQMDWIEGPLVGYEPGPDGAGAALLYRLMQHFTGPDFAYAHHWRRGDLVIYDNRSLIHSATWYDADRHERVMWRTTVHGNPGPLYDGEEKSWIAQPVA